MANTNMEKYLIYMDINKTIIVDDKSGNKSITDSINSMMAEKKIGVWAKGLEPMSYYDYVHKVLFPHEKSNTNMKKVCQRLLFHFTEEGQPGEQYREEFDEYMSKLENMETPILDSFFKFIEVLNDPDLNINYTMIFRTFGLDIPEVTEILNKKYPGFIGLFGYFKENNNELWVYEDPEFTQLIKVVKGPENIYKFFKELEVNIAVRDRYPYWHANNEKRKFGKLLPYDSSDVEVISVFYDDNVEVIDEENGIIYPYDCSKGIMDMGGVYLLKVDTLKAIKDEFYFVYA